MFSSRQNDTGHVILSQRAFFYLRVGQHRTKTRHIPCTSPLHLHDCSANVYAGAPTRLVLRRTLVPWRDRSVWLS